MNIAGMCDQIPPGRWWYEIVYSYKTNICPIVYNGALDSQVEVLAKPKSDPFPIDEHTGEQRNVYSSPTQTLSAHQKWKSKHLRF